MAAIGILLPGSTLYPAIGVDFLQGIKACFAYNQVSGITWHNVPIGYGLNDEEIYKEAEKLLLAQDVDIVIAYADDRVAKTLSPLFAAAGKLLLVVNTGAHYPVLHTDITHTLLNTHNDSLYSYMTGQLCGRLTDNKKTIVATSYYDGGYQHCHAMTEAYMAAGGEITFNFISHFKKQDFTIQPLAAFIQSNPAVNTLLCLYSGDMARCFYEQIAPLQKQYNLHLYGSPMLFDSTPGDFSETHPYVQSITGYVGYTPSLNNTHNSIFTGFLKKEYNKAANLFSLQGWETALLAISYLQHKQNGASVPEAIDCLKKQPVQSPRGPLTINNKNVVTGPAYLVNATGALQVQVEETIENTAPVFDEMMAQIPDTMFTNWRNTYLCI